MLEAKKVNELLGIKDSYQAPQALMDIVMNEEKLQNLMTKLLQHEPNLKYEWFQKYFEDEHSDRKNKKQDFTPQSISTLLQQIAGPSDSYFESAAGTGGIMIQSWKENKDHSDRIYYLEELSSRSVPFLLFNMAIRNINGFVFHGDSLEKKYEAVYMIKKGKINQIDIGEVSNVQAETVLMNPPYSANWSADKSFLEDERFKPYGKLPPKSKADFAFVLHGYHQLSPNGTMAVVLPHGVLFRGAVEGTIRQHLLEQGAIEAVIGLPEKLFLNTGIPTVILVLKKGRSKRDVMFIDASKEFEKGKSGQNFLSENHLNNIISAYRNKTDIDKYAHLASYDELNDNEFNLNIPRFVDTFEEEEPIDMGALALEIAQLDVEIKESEKELGIMLQDLEVPSGDPELIQALELTKSIFGVKSKKKADKEDQITLEI